MNNTDLGTLAIIVGLALVTVLTRSFFFISSKSWQLPHWAQRGLQYAPIAALSAAIAGAAAVVAYSLPLKLNIVVAIAVAVILCLTVEKLRPAPGLPA